jgi:serine protease Do
VSRQLPGLVVVLGVLLALLIVPYFVERLQYAATRGEQRAKAEAARALLAEMPEANQRFRLVAQSVAPSVVGITTEQLRGGGLPDEWASDPRFQTRGEGSGVIVDEAGYVVTNFHVIKGATSVHVELADGRTINRVEVVGVHPLTDLAVLKIRAGGLTAASWGDSDELQVGDEVLAVGNPFGFDRTVTAGIVSAKDRREMLDPSDQYARYKEYLQTDAAVNPGNSGGPLVNLNGEVVGINTAIVGPTFQGISFAIPSRLAKEVYEKLKAGVAPGWLGVSLTDLDERIAAQLGLEDVRGALVVRVLEDSPADRARLQDGDVIIRWNGQQIADQTELSRAVARTEPGSRAEVTVIRNGREQKLSVTVGRRPLQL